MLFDNKTGSNLLLWPVEEVESLRLSSDEFEGVVVKPGSVVPLNISLATQVCLSIELCKFTQMFLLHCHSQQLYSLTTNLIFQIYPSWTYLLNLRLNG